MNKNKTRSLRMIKYLKIYKRVKKYQIDLLFSNPLKRIELMLAHPHESHFQNNFEYN